MKFSILVILLSSCFICNPFLLTAQSQPVEVTGRIVESRNQQPIEFATVLLVDPNTEKALTGTSTNTDGTFSLSAPSQNFFVKITFIGFETKIIEKINVIDGKASLGVILLTDNNTTLDEVVIQAEKSQTEFKLDKRIFNVGKDLSSTGASALELLNNVPSVNVNIEGEISLRGSSGVQILINGKPSVLASEEGNALGTLTADMIEKIEVITNPSAKYDAEGTSGIINIILKKEERKGINGSATINTGTPHNHSFGLSLNRRTEKFNLFTQMGVGYRELPNDVENINRDLINNTAVLSNGEEFRNETFYNFILGTDYHINKYNVITLSGHFAYEIEDQPSETFFRFEEATGTISSEWRREEITEATNPKYQYELNYKKDFKDNKEHTLIFSALGDFFGKDQSSEFFDTTLSGEDRDGQQQTRTNFKEAEYFFKLDYTKPFTQKITFETGSQYVINDVSNDFAVSNLINEEFVPDPTLTNIFEFNQKVLGTYGTGAYEGDRWGIKLGLRLEYTDLSTLLLNTNEANNQNYTNLFPSAHTSYKFSELFSLQAGYSRRIYRPRLWDLNPFFNIRNNFNVRVGNPNLQPEFTDSYEVNSIMVIEKLSLNFGIYHRYTTDVIERISSLENVEIGDTVQSVNFTRPINTGTNRTTGLEFNVKYSPNKIVTINGDFNFNYFNRQGTFETEREGIVNRTDFDFQADQFSTKWTTKFKLPAKIDFEITGHYQSRFQTVQGTMQDNLFADMGLRKKLMNGKGVINLSIRDIFASRIMERETMQPDFFAYSRRQRGRFITLGFSYGFGKGEAMEFSGQKRF